MKLIHISELKLKKGIPYHEQHVRKLSKAGRFPKPIPGFGRTLFDESEIDAHLEALKAQRDGGTDATAS
jgi:hypothetical protein